MGVLYISFSTLYTIFSALVFVAVVAIIISHLYSRWKRPKPLKLTSDSIVVIFGGCMGIGKVMAVEIARLYHSTIILVDRRKELFEAVSQ